MHLKPHEQEVTADRGPSTLKLGSNGRAGTQTKPLISVIETVGISNTRTELVLLKRGVTVLLWRIIDCTNNRTKLLMVHTMKKVCIPCRGNHVQVGVLIHANCKRLRRGVTCTSADAWFTGVK
ncbi:hypothetical protein EVAR_93084_1 [Eumeta japonica]|uniref:Uncharacterized protein n=1 Tax=Eumeta variegata TaxID=151549 RepID=A0A4C1TFX9_EUMVA|nr:hypothetical protein EVAR_93084_1 [Eumeta japonica]